MKTIARLILAAVSLAILPSCANQTGANPPKPVTLSPEARAAVNEGLKIGVAATIGYLEGGKAGAVAGALGQSVTDLKKLQASQLTAAKNPVAPVQ